METAGGVKVISSWTLQLFIGGKRIDIPGFSSEVRANQAGIFLQLAHDGLSLFEVKEVRGNETK